MNKKDKAKIYNSREWRDLRVKKLSANYLCERCLKEHDWYVPARCVHHIVPIESARNMAEMKRLAFSWSNLQSLCFQCHSDIHKDRKSRTREGHEQAAQSHLERWVERIKNKDYGL